MGRNGIDSLMTQARNGDLQANLELMKAYARGEGPLGKDIMEANRWGANALKLSEDNYKFSLSPDLFSSLIDNGNRGDKDSCVQLALIYTVDSNVAFKDMLQAKTWMRRAVDYYSGKVPQQKKVRSSHSETIQRTSNYRKPYKHKLSRSLFDIQIFPSGELEVPRFVYSSVNVLSWTFAILAGLYLISPIDAVPDVIPVAGWMDDVGVAGSAVVVILVLRFLPKVVKILNEILNVVNRILTVGILILLSVLGILGVLVYKFFIIQ